MATFTAPADAGPTRKVAKDAVLSAAVELAREAAAAEAGDEIGEHLGFVLEGERLGTHYFAATAAGYIGWRWYVTLSRAPRSRKAAVCESGLLPGDGALLAPEWLPWADRLAPGDLGPSDRLPYNADDERLESGYVATGDAEKDRVAIRELGLGRDRVMNAKALDAAATRWHSGSQGPDTSGSRSAGADCATCGFIVPLAGSLGQVFGVCANEWSPDDGKVVALDHGCGAHSETDAAHAGGEWVQTEPHLDELDVEVVATPEPSADSETADGAEGTDKAETADGAEGTDKAETADGAEGTDKAEKVAKSEAAEEVEVSAESPSEATDVDAPDSHDVADAEGASVEDKHGAADSNDRQDAQRPAGADQNAED